MRVMGFDPGSRVTGYGVLDFTGGGPKHVDNGVFVLPANQALAVRLGELVEKVEEVLDAFKPDVAAIESVFTHRNVKSAVVLAQARGAILSVLGRRGIAVSEYAPALVKTTVTGYGRAEKTQMQRMIAALLSLPETAAEDASDALAVGICHLRHARLSAMTPVGGRS